MVTFLLQRPFLAFISFPSPWVSVLGAPHRGITQDVALRSGFCP